MEDDDPLKQFRRPGATRAERRAEPPPPPGTPKRYRAFDAQDKLLCLEIRRVLGTTHAPTYAYLLNIAFDHEYFTGFVLYYTFMRVKVRGKNLKDVITALKLRKCEYIQDFHPSEYAPPKPDEPLIESITVEWREPIMSGSDEEEKKGEGEKPGARP
jgi:hypothetical protein